jgi:hypothetical protein
VCIHAKNKQINVILLSNSLEEIYPLLTRIDLISLYLYLTVSVS